MKWIAPALAYFAVGIGLFQFHSAWGALLGFHAAIVFSLLIARPSIPIIVLLKSRKSHWIILSVLLCGSSGVTLYLIWSRFGVASDLSEQVTALGLNASTWPMFIGYFVLVNPFIEEYFWRGYLGNPTNGLYISDFIYAGFHALILVEKVQTGSIIYSLTLLVLAGWFWRQIAHKNQGLLAPVLGHMAADFTILIAVYLNV